MKLQIEIPEFAQPLIEGIARIHKQTAQEWAHESIMDRLAIDLDAAGTWIADNLKEGHAKKKAAQ